MPDWFTSRFSPVGFAVVVLQQIPGIIWALRPPKLDPFARNSGTLLVEILEKTFGIATILLLVLVLAKAPLLPSWSKAFLVSAFVILATYYGFYVVYYLGITRLPVLLGMAVFPPMCFWLLALYQGNYPALVTSVIFGIVHVGLTYKNFAPGR